MASTTRTYAEALTLLSTLQSNKAITSLFAPSPAPSSSPPSPKPDLNALAIPEMLLWLNRAGYTPQDLARLRTIHVAGTKGKGSVSALTTSILIRYPAVAGRVGTYTSPHVVSVRERIMLDGEPIGKELFAKYFFELWERFGASAKAEGREGEEGGVRPFYFRFLTVLAWHVFLGEGVRSAVVECGIGGEYDATNVLPAEGATAAVVTQLGVDHVAMLGGTVEEIAWHKAGVFKKGVKGFTRRLEGREGVMRVLRERAAEKGATLVEVPDEKVDWWEGVEDAKLKGDFQKYNMALAVAAAREHLLKLGHGFEGPFAGEDYKLRDMPEEFYEGLKTASLRGRCEYIKDEETGVEWYLDGAHTEESLEAAGEWYGLAAGDDGSRFLVFNQQERDAPHLLTVLLRAVKLATVERNNYFAVAIFCRNEEDPPAEGETRDLSVQEANERVCRAFDPCFRNIAIRTEDSVKPALHTILDCAREYRHRGVTIKVLVTGSFHLVGAVIKKIEHVEE
ncbi:FolC bifunctional protein [Coniochaeta ligniaria NRRL 30616]|uniref:Folylpolyglutamate synthase n=1 Tax=Coniochaeta ligniaria NRRL 30616 TaxID=1408157 RepID=A0A1J7IS98_9PEZI|nr:FolC bifunctional protein [Coniochaeta ligniaria NRRL 30616]